MFGFLMPLMLTPMVFYSDPIAFYIGSFPIRWYSLSYLVSMIMAWWMGRRVSSQDGITSLIWDHSMVAMCWGVIVGGRVGYFFLYEPWNLFSWNLFALWEGGMSFHGGFLGVLCAMLYAARSYRIAFWALADRAALVCPIGLFFGRLANFINQEHVGRLTQKPWGIIFAHHGSEVRHPSALYEAVGEGVLLGIILWVIKYRRLAKQGNLALIFCFGYALIRFVCEFWRTPDGLWYGITLGQWYSFAMILIAFFVLWLKRRSQ